MLRKCSSVSILVSDENQKAKCKTVASQIKVDVNKIGEVILCDGKNLSKISHNNYDKVVLILNNESPVTYIKEGITRFIFDFDNIYELCVAMYTDRPSETIYDSNDCYFDFAQYYNNLRDIDKEGCYIDGDVVKESNGTNYVATKIPFSPDFFAAEDARLELYFLSR